MTMSWDDDDDDGVAESLRSVAAAPQMVKWNGCLLEVVREMYRYVLVTKLGRAIEVAAASSP